MVSRHDIKSGKALATFKKTNQLILKFLDDGIVSEVEINEKKVKQVSFKVIDQADDTEKDFNCVSKRLIEALDEFPDTTNMVLIIDKIGSGFDTTYMVKEYPKPKKQTKVA